MASRDVEGNCSGSSGTIGVGLSSALPNAESVCLVDDGQRGERGDSSWAEQEGSNSGYCGHEPQYGHPGMDLTANVEEGPIEQGTKDTNAG